MHTLSIPVKSKANCFFPYLDEGVILLKQVQVPSFEEILESQGKDLIVDETVEGMLTNTRSTNISLYASNTNLFFH